MKHTLLGIVAVVVVGVAVFWFIFMSGGQAVKDGNGLGITLPFGQTASTTVPEGGHAAAPDGGATNPNNPNKKIMKATLHTTKGVIVIELYTNDAPNTVANFTKLAQTGFYTGTKFHRVIKGFMVQGGDPLSKDDSMMARWGTGGPGYQFNDEIHTNNRNAPGTISMANAGPNTNGSQFFINTADNAFLDTKHTTFGKVVSGLEVVSAIENTPTAPGDRPLEPMVITSITLE
jgi:cyclophilin family peptidyl-prolyl cis-trans isomerase